MTDDQLTAVDEPVAPLSNGSAHETAPESEQQSTSPGEWDEFVHWAKRFYEWEEFDETERNYKIDYAKRVQQAREAMFTNNSEWLTLLKRSLRGSAHPVTWRVSAQFNEWCSEHPEEAREALSVIWTEDLDPVDRVRAFLDKLPRDGVKSPSGRISLAAYLQSALDPESLPIYRVTVFENTFKLTNFPWWPQDADQAGHFEHAVRFLDTFIEEAAKRGLHIRDRLDAQGLIWMLPGWAMDWEPIIEWSEEDREAFRLFQLGEKALQPDHKMKAPPPTSSTIDALADRLLIDIHHLQEIQNLLRAKGQVIFYGPPGTGKTFVARELARFFAAHPDDPEEDGLVEVVQFHPSYAYEDFVEGYRPRKSGDGMAFELVEGPLKWIAQAAESAPEMKHVLIIDEINRGNVAKVLGELYFLLEYRDEPIRLQYSEDEFKLPENLWIIGTMNTADRSIALIDAALRRRFYFVPFFPDEPPIEGLLRRWLERERQEMLWVADVLDRVNAELGDRHGAIGPSYFMKRDLDERWVKRIWEHAVLPYLAEQFFGEEDRLDAFRLDRLRGLDSEPADDDALSES